MTNDAFNSPFPPSDPEIFFASPPRLSPKSSAETFYGNAYEQNENTAKHLISILSAGSIHAKFPYFFSLKPLGCYLLLYTESGCGKLYIEEEVHLLENATLLLLKCDVPFKIETTVSPWEYTVFFLKGDLLNFYYGFLPAGTIPLFNLPEYSEPDKVIRKLTANKTDRQQRNKLTDHKLLTDILTWLLLDSTADGSQSQKIPAYLHEVKTLFDSRYQENYTLDGLAEHFSVSKYRLCREFHDSFGRPPLQYLNERRIDAAKNLLLTTNCRIHEIGSLIGIDNTNHFIYLFKKFTGMTPLAFRKKK